MRKKYESSPPPHCVWTNTCTHHLRLRNENPVTKFFKIFRKDKTQPRHFLSKHLCPITVNANQKIQKSWFRTDSAQTVPVTVNRVEDPHNSYGSGPESAFSSMRIQILLLCYRFWLRWDNPLFLTTTFLINIGNTSKCRRPYLDPEPGSS